MSRSCCLTCLAPRENDDIDELKLDKWPRPSRRRDPGNRARIEAALFAFLDEQLLIDKLPNIMSAKVLTVFPRPSGSTMTYNC